MGKKEMLKEIGSAIENSDGDELIYDMILKERKQAQQEFADYVVEHGFLNAKKKFGLD